MINNWKMILTTSIVVFATLFSFGEAVLCYDCNSAFDPRCGDPFDPFGLGTVNCSYQERLEHINNIEPTLCRKISQKVYGKMRVVRGCGYITDARDNAECAKRSGTHDVMVHYCSCTTDLCNSANKIHHYYILQYLAVINIIYFIF